MNILRSTRKIPIFSFLISLICIFDLIKSDSFETRTFALKTLRSLTAEHLASFPGDSSPIFGNTTALNYYYVDIWIGNPPQRQSVIIDTGSHITAVPCQPFCEKCGSHLNKYYDMRNSNESSVIDCKTKECDDTGYGSCNKDGRCSYHIVNHTRRLIIYFHQFRLT